MTELLLFLPLLLAGGYHGLNVLDAVRQSGDRLPLELYGFLLLMTFGFAGRLLYLLPQQRERMHRVFFVSGLSLGLLFMFAMPGLSAPDEMSHYSSAYRLSSRLLGAPELTEAGLLAVRAGDYPLEDLSGVKTPEIGDDVEPVPEVLGNPLRLSTYRAIRDWDRRYAGGEELVSSALPDVRTTPVMYLPQALGFAAARLLKLNAPTLLALGKLMNLLVYLLLTAAAIRLLPFGKEALFGAALLPMSLHLAGSLSYDAGILGTSFLLTAEILHLRYGEAELKGRDMLLLILLTAALGPCKMVYAPLVLLFCLVPAERCGGRKKKLLCFAALLAALMLAMLLVNAEIIRAYASAGRELSAASGAAEDAAPALVDARAGYTVSELIRRPVFIARMVLNCFSLQSGMLLTGMIGMQLGNMDPLLGAPFFAVLFYMGGLLLLSLREEWEAERLSLKTRGAFAGISLVVILLIAGAMLISWTTREAAMIEGIQGRYFLPLLPLLLAAAGTGDIRLRRGLKLRVLQCFIILDSYVALRIFALACMRL
ncbi:putative membrane protein DUF2142 [Fusobacterium naviforme]|nr:DUF2142 domain-containing protein [Fusobacterium naviforme]PSL10418.1 putative membrane protein DUF2142 [Fusobacterium naviforme]STO28115.1 Predicted membrane protein [Fusobacterium naviforme]